MRFMYFATVVAATFAWANTIGAHDEDRNHLLRGTFAETGFDTCFYDAAGFDSNFVPVPPPNGTSDITIQARSTLGTRVFNGDGTGSDDATVMIATILNSPPGSFHVSSKIKYTITPDLTVTIENDGPITARVILVVSSARQLGPLYPDDRIF